ncbi:MAG: T9SS type A sorting domain-containing protein [Bacteroidales bacterium]|nr:T9SS type A sorting domain-containing protein [Bacteroidales bacterium]
MKKIASLLSFLAIMVILPWVGFAQEAEWVEQVIVANGNAYESSPPFVDFVTVQTYNPANGATSVFDEIKTQSVQDVVIANNKIYVAAQDSIVMYDANTLQRLMAIADSGLSRICVLKDWLIVTKQYPIVRFFAEVLNANDLSLIARIQNISGDCKGIAGTLDSVYIAVNGGYLSTTGKLAVINVTNWTLSREIDFGSDAAGINDIYNYGGTLFCINETPYGSSDSGSITAYNTYAMTHINYLLGLHVGNGAPGIKNSGTVGNMLYLTLNYGIGSFNMDTRVIEDTTIFPDPGFVNHISFTSYTTDYVNSYLYMNVGNLSSWGINLVGTTAGDSVTSFITGFNTDAIALDYRVPVGIDDPVTRETSIAIFPNPAENMVRIKYTGDAPVAEILIRDLTGRTIYRNNERTVSGTWIDCSSYPAGLYFVTVKTDSNTLSTKLIKK